MVDLLQYKINNLVIDCFEVKLYTIYDIQKEAPMFHERLKELRSKSGKTQKDLAEYLNISPQSISKWEKGESSPSLEYLPKIAKFLNCDINSLFEEIDLSNIKETLIDLENLKDELKNTYDNEPDEEDNDDEDEYEIWERRVAKLEWQISELKDKLKSANALGRCSNEKYEEFFAIAESTFINGEDESKLSQYLAQNETIKNNISFLYKLITTKNAVSISMVQYYMDVGFITAGTIVDGLEKIRIASPFDEKSKSRKINYEQLQKLKQLLNV